MDWSPTAWCLGEVVETYRRPFLWLLDLLPFLVTDATKLRVTCPPKYRIYADRVEHNVPYFKEELTIIRPDFDGKHELPNPLLGSFAGIMIC